MLFEFPFYALKFYYNQEILIFSKTKVFMWCYTPI